MLDYTPLHDNSQTPAQFSEWITYTDLYEQTDEMIDAMLSSISSATDADVTFVPTDPNAKDTFGNPAEENLAWTLGHVVVHATASAEEAAAIASVLARGITPEGRSRYETNWETVTTIEQVRQRFEESRRIRLAYLNAWPDAPHLDVAYTPIPHFGPLNATARFIIGLLHDDTHLGQLHEIMRQVKAKRGA